MANRNAVGYRTITVKAERIFVIVKNDVIVPDWPLHNRVKALATSRNGGCSLPPFDECNLALHVGDNVEHVLANRAKLRSLHQIPNEPRWLCQQHGNLVVDAAKIDPDTAKADGVFTTQTEVVCAVLTADCLPILLSDAQGTCVGAVHAGWRGLLAGVIQKTIARMAEFTKPEYAWLGPAIGPTVFEVGEDVFIPYVSENDHLREAFTPASPGKWKLNIYQAAKVVLRAADTNHIFGGNHCTYSEEKRFYSYRRDSETGRNATLIWIP